MLNVFLNPRGARPPVFKPKPQAQWSWNLGETKLRVLEELQRSYPSGLDSFDLSTRVNEPDTDKLRVFLNQLYKRGFLNRQAIDMEITQKDRFGTDYNRITKGWEWGITQKGADQLVLEQARREALRKYRETGESPKELEKEEVAREAMQEAEKGFKAAERLIEDQTKKAEELKIKNLKLVNEKKQLQDKIIRLEDERENLLDQIDEARALPEPEETTKELPYGMGRSDLIKVYSEPKFNGLSDDDIILTFEDYGFELTDDELDNIRRQQRRGLPPGRKRPLLPPP